MRKSSYKLIIAALGSINQQQLLMLNKGISHQLLEIVFSMKLNLLFILWSWILLPSASDNLKSFSGTFSGEPNLYGSCNCLLIPPQEASSELDNKFLTSNCYRFLWNVCSWFCFSCSFGELWVRRYLSPWAICSCFWFPTWF